MSGAGALAGLEVEQEGVAVQRDGAQLVEVGIEAVGDDAAVAQQHSGRLKQRGLQALGHGRVGRQGRAHLLQQRAFARHAGQQRGQAQQGVAQTGEFARAHLAQGDAGVDALDVAHLAQRLADGVEALRGFDGRQQRGDGVVAGAGHGAVAQRLGQPLAQATAAHAGAAGVNQREQRGRVFAAQGLHQLQVAQGGRRQVEQFGAARHLQRGHVGQRPALRVLGVAQQRSASGVRQRHLLGVPALQVLHLQLLAQLAQAQAGVELPGGAIRQGDAALRRAQHGGDGRRHALAVVEDLGRLQARQPTGELGRAALGQAQLAAGQAQPGQGARHLVFGMAAALVHDHGQQQRVGALGQQLGVDQGARGDHAHHLAFDRPLAGTDLAHLLADGHRLALADELGKVGLERMHRHPGHHHWLAVGLAAHGQGDVDEAVGLASIVEEELVEVTHPVEDERIGVLRFDAQVLLHHRRVAGVVTRSGWGA